MFTYYSVLKAQAINKLHIPYQLKPTFRFMCDAILCLFLFCLFKINIAKLSDIMRLPTFKYLQKRLDCLFRLHLMLNVEVIKHQVHQHHVYCVIYQ